MNPNPPTEQIEAWKAKYGEVFEVTVLSSEEGQAPAKGYFRKPTRAIVANSARFAQGDPFKSSEILFKGCLIECDEEMNTNDEVYISAVMKVAELMQIREAEIKKL
jgi:hypothetical protein